MIYILLKENIKSFEADVRDLVMSFYPYQDYTFINVDKNNNIIFDDNLQYADISSINNEKNVDSFNSNNKRKMFNDNDVIIKDFYGGKIYKDRIDTKNHLKRSLYKYLSKKTGRKLPWGTLTGIRPVNIITEGVAGVSSSYLLDKKNNRYDKKKVSKYLKDEYLVSNDKIKELLDISNNEKKILDRKELKDYKNRCSVYIGIPFCKTTCLYCSFTSYSIDRYEDMVDNYLDALDNEIKENIKIDNKKGKKKDDIENPLTLYVGGGTPTSLSEAQFEKFLIIVDKYFHTKNKKGYLEYTIEAGRPDTITEKKLILMKNYGVTRISINPQTFNQKTLDLIGRKHKVEDVVEKYKVARELGFDNINMDIILGLPKENLDDVVKTLIKLGNLDPDNITVHSLALKRAARLNYELDSWIGNLESEDINNMFKCSQYLMKILKQKSYYLYRQKNMKQNLENVGYSKIGKECIYNIMMMGEKHTVYGFGCGGVGKKVEYKKDEKIVTRMKGTKSLVDYIGKYLCMK